MKPLCGGSGGGRSQSSVDFLISSEETGFRHLYYVKAGLNMGNQIPEGKGFEGCGVHRGICKPNYFQTFDFSNDVSTQAS